MLRSRFAFSSPRSIATLQCKHFSALKLPFGKDEVKYFSQVLTFPVRNHWQQEN